ncbi:FAD binding domain-containing protein [Annulohypoxylon maeteangense]|uniref:FAD binding domain-containing protein n=1 Tax=Annulohypoxylon maeteangense TaxID=1927788 RepID=UPI00200778C0|nr:FAD binding domain-containing protein [Annulohypoxylon maeteangense]KAI0881206.1 FAD binding domain-containing protein [Annulohypoxylon maeteangense]
MEENVDCVDVLIVGAGPVGLITAFQLALFGGVSVRIIEKHAKSMQDSYGRAITLFPRTVEMLDQLHLADTLLQSCFACRDTVTYNAKGEEVPGRGWSFMNKINDTTFDFALVLRQKFQEEVFRNAMATYNVQVEAPVELTAASVDSNVPSTGYRVSAVLLDRSNEAYRKIRCKYLIGCDGGRSSVRRMFNIPFEGSASEDKWVRIDGQIKTDMPKPRSYCSIESPTHGNVLWVALDHGATRIGYAFTDDRANAYPKFDEDAAVKEAVDAVKPFNIEFERVDWWTIYAVGQRTARNFLVHECVLLAGDACHTHSSGAAQGMNTGIHDAVNLAWKLSLTIRRLTNGDLLKTYQAERLPNVQKLIQYDRDISRLMTNRLPENWQGDPDADVNVVLGQLFEESSTFNTGLGISYGIQEENPLNVEGSFTSSQPLIRPGRRGPDITLLRPGSFERTRLIRELRNHATFHILVFTSERGPALPEVVYEDIAGSPVLQLLVNRSHLDFMTILPGFKVPSPYEFLGHAPLGRAYFDGVDKAAYQRYGIGTHGAIVVLRPDGWIGTMIKLGIEAISELEGYLKRIFPKI